MVKLKEFTALSRVAIELDGVWYTHEASQTKELDFGDNEKEEVEKNWNEVNAQLNNQIDDLLCLTDDTKYKKFKKYRTDLFEKRYQKEIEDNTK